MELSQLRLLAEITLNLFAGTREQCAAAAAAITMHAGMCRRSGGCILLATALVYTRIKRK